MSFSLQFTGTPEQIAEKLKTEEAALSGYSQKELRDARPALETLLSQNVGGEKLTLIASGHAVFENEQRQTGNLRIELRSASADESHESDAANESRSEEEAAKANEEVPLSPRGRTSGRSR